MISQKEKRIILGSFKSSFCLLGLLSLLFFSGCRFDRVHVKLPPPESSIKKRIDAYNKYRYKSKETVRKTHVSRDHHGFMQSETKIRTYMVLGDGSRVSHFKDLLPLVADNSITAKSIQKYSFHRSRAATITWGGTGASLGLSILSFATIVAISPSPNASNPNSGFSLGMIVAPSVFVLGSATSFIWGMIEASKGRRHIQTVFRSYNRDLARNLKLLPE